MYSQLWHFIPGLIQLTRGASCTYTTTAVATGLLNLFDCSSCLAAQSICYHSWGRSNSIIVTGAEDKKRTKKRFDSDSINSVLLSSCHYFWRQEIVDIRDDDSTLTPAPHVHRVGDACCNGNYKSVIRPRTPLKPKNKTGLLLLMFHVYLLHPHHRQQIPSILARHIEASGAQCAPLVSAPMLNSAMRHTT
jgi:hypothetical protein